MKGGLIFVYRSCCLLFSSSKKDQSAKKPTQLSTVSLAKLQKQKDDLTLEVQNLKESHSSEKLHSKPIDCFNPEIMECLTTKLDKKTNLLRKEFEFLEECTIPSVSEKSNTEKILELSDEQVHNVHKIVMTVSNTLENIALPQKLLNRHTELQK